MKLYRILSMLSLLALLAACGSQGGTPVIYLAPTLTPAPPPAGVLLVFTRTGGVNAYCDEITVGAGGAIHYRDTCKGGTADGALDPSDAAFLQSLAERVGRYQYVPPTPAPPAPPNAIALGLTLYGHGTAPAPTNAEEMRLLDLAQRANDGLRATHAGATPVVGSLENVAAMLATAHGDANVIRSAIAGYLALPEIRGQTDADAALILQGLLGKAAVYSTYVAAVEVKRLGPNREFALVNHPVPSITLYGPSGWLVVADGTHIEDARLDGDRLGVISVREADQRFTSLTLLRSTGAEWRVAWRSSDNPEWQAADGGAAFAGDGLTRLSVAGLSLSPMPGETDPPIYECLFLCPRRTLSATWTLAAGGESYTRVSSLPPVKPGEALDASLWDMTVRDEYGVAFEFLRRLRAGDRTGALALAAGEPAVDSAVQLELDRREVTVDNQTYRTAYSASRPDAGVVRVRRFGVYTLPDGSLGQIDLATVITLSFTQVDGEWRVQAVTK